MRAALTYQHATVRRDRAIGDALARKIVDSGTAEAAIAEGSGAVGHSSDVTGDEPSGRPGR